MGNKFGMEAKGVLKEAGQSIMGELLDQEVIISVSRKCLDKLEENEIFAEATKKGMSKEFIKSMVVPPLNYLIENLNLEKFNASMTMALINGALHEELDLTSFTGEYIFDIMDSVGVFDEMYKPEFKKNIIFNEAIELAALDGNISLNMAVERAIENMQSKEYAINQIEKANKLSDKIASSINSIVEFYLKNETAIILAIMAKK